MRIKAFLIILVFAFISCGGGGGGAKKFVPRKKKHAKKEKKEKKVEHKLIPNKKWELIKDFFEKYNSLPIASMKDFFKSHLDKFMPKIEMPEVKEEKVIEKKEIPAIEKYPPEDYKLIMIISGTDVPKAIVVDPDGKAHIIRKNSRIGNRQGVVEMITNYEVIIREPFKEKPVILSIKPEYIKWEDLYQYK